MNTISNTTTPNFDTLLLQSLMTRLKLHPSPPSFESLLLPSDSDSDSETDTQSQNPTPSRSRLSKAESDLEKHLIRTILSGDTASLNPNSGQAVSVGEHYVCVGSHQEAGSEYRVWEWHGHVMLFDEESGYTPEYVYGNYFERVVRSGGGGGGGGSGSKKEAEEEKVESLGLRELIRGADNGGSRVIHCGRNAGSPR